ncbi:hypothetical protein [Amycolatopsis sp. NPDC051102]|uniref:hypothetical protein n=1 Tax=Amycolatopsis sp. NPDC051102 TaxID=3155163 RepID=UPI00343C7492
MRRRLRTLRVGERDYTWRATIGHVAGDGDEVHRCIRVRVWGAGKNSRALEADLLSKAVGDGWPAVATDGSYPAPADVRCLVAHALTAGWEPAAPGGVFRLTEAHGLELPGFLITDRVRDPAAADPTGRVIRAFGRQDGRV